MKEKIMRSFSGLINVVFNPFDMSPGKNGASMKRIYVLFLVSLIVISAIFVDKAFYVAEKKHFWCDEAYGLESTIRSNSQVELLWKGASGQGSPAPLDYMLVKFLDVNRDSFKFFGLHPNVYYRLVAIFASLLSGVGVILFVFRKISREVNNSLSYGLQCILLLAALMVYYFWPFNFRFSVEMRPYSLWNALWFITLILFLEGGSLRKAHMIFLPLLAFTATASIFQLSCLGVSYAFMSVLNKKSVKNILKNILKFFLLPALVALFYCLRSKYTPTGASLSPEHIREFFRFWTTKEMIPLLSLCGIASAFYTKEYKEHAGVFLAILLLYLIAPVINYMTLSRGFFFSSRQYIYYDLIYSVFFVHIAVVLPCYLKKCRQACSE